MPASPATAFPARGSPDRLSGTGRLPADARAASIRRHPSWAGAAPVACTRCGFRPPPRSAIPAALADLPSVWSSHLERHDDPATTARAARLRDELQGVANRITRIVEQAPAVVADVEIDAPTVLAATATEPGHVVELLRSAAERAAEVVGRLTPEDWRRHAGLGDRRIDVGELAVLPLHRSHARLGGRLPCR